MSESAASAKSKNSWRTQSAILIDLIVPYLRNPIPAPLSCPPRNALRQQGLATAMRVSKRVNKVARPHLYTHIVTDDSAKVFALASQAGKKSPFHLTRSLRLEYRDKSFNEQTTYEPIFVNQKKTQRRELWSHMGMTFDEQQKRRIRLCGEEARDLQDSLGKINLSKVLTWTFLPKLETIIVGSIYGDCDGIWALHDASCGDIGGSDIGSRRHRELTSLVFQYFISTSNVRFTCYRDLYGPLAPTPAMSRPIRLFRNSTSHFDSSETERLLSQPAEVCRWIYDGPSENSWEHLIRALGGALVADLTLIHPGRPRSIEASPRLIISCSTANFENVETSFNPHTNLFEAAVPISTSPGTSPPLSPLVQLGMASKLRVAAQQYVTSHPNMKRNKGKLSIAWEPSHLAIPCEICSTGWGI